ncbi:MAG: hypothetical protein PUE04_08820 [Lachnospira sp.]|nr:hypothetical protein [Lachnospira sp.]
MIKEGDILPLNFFNYGGIFSGSCVNMRFKIRRKGGGDDPYKLEALVWPGPYDERDTKEELIRHCEFPCTEEGRSGAIAWLNEMYEEGGSEFSEKKGLLDADGNLRDPLP